MNHNTDTRWDSWMGRARTCFRAASAIDSSSTAVSTTLRDLEGAAQSPPGVLEQLRLAEAALTRARDAVQAALQARKLTPSNREPSYGLAG